MNDSDIRAHYDAYPYPDRDPAAEHSRLIQGSPSWPPEMDHWIWGGARDWRQPLRALVAGGGTGDGLVQIAQTLTSAGRPYDITYVDLSENARQIAEARVSTRSLAGVTFVTGSFLDQIGRFDYIDCCGVLHHLPDPACGLESLARMLAPGGGIGLMVYAPHGRSGVYPLQSAFRALFGHLAPENAVRQAKEMLRRVPAGHPFKRNLQIGDHETSDAGFFDLLLHSQDQALTISALHAMAADAGLEISGAAEPAIYDPRDLLTSTQLYAIGDPVQRMQLAEDLRGTIKSHVVYLVKAGARVPPPMGRADAIPVLCGADACGLAEFVADGRPIPLDLLGNVVEAVLPAASAPLIAAINGQRPLSGLADVEGLSMRKFSDLWTRVEEHLVPYGHLHYSSLYAA